VAFALVLIVWVLFAFEMAFGHPMHIFGVSHGILANLWGKPGDILNAADEQGQAAIPLVTTGPPFHFPTATLAYFQFVFAAITPILMLGSVLGRINLMGQKPTLIGSVNGMITGLVVITPAAGYVNGWGALAIGVIGATIVYFALNYLSRLRPFRSVDDTLGVVYTHGFAGLAGGLLTGIFADPNMAVYYRTSGHKLSTVGATGVLHGNWTLLKWQFFAAMFV